MYAKESQHQKVMISFYEKITLATFELLDKGIEICCSRIFSYNF